MTKKKIGVIGAGIAGLSCAKELVSAGFDVTVFDKGRGVGGRMSHRHFENWGADHGAQYFTVKNPLFAKEAEIWLKENVIAPWQGRLAKIDNTVAEYQDEVIRYVGTPGMNAPAKYLAQGHKLHTSYTVTEIKRSQGYWSVVTKECGELEYAFDFIIFAIPSVQAKHLIDRYSTSLRDLCESAKMLPCWTLMAYLKNPLSLNFDGAFVKNHMYSWIARDSDKPERSIYESWVAQASPEWSTEHVDIAPAEVEQYLTEGFKDLTGCECDLYQTHLWRYARLETPQELNYSIDSQAKLAVCGDWLRNSTVEDAWLSGYYLGRGLSEALR